MKSDQDLVAEFLAKGGKVTKCPSGPAGDLEPTRPGQSRAIRDHHDMRLLPGGSRPDPRFK